jgi:hypothetical protein
MQHRDDEGLYFAGNMAIPSFEEIQKEIVDSFEDELNRELNLIDSKIEEFVSRNIF